MVMVLLSDYKVKKYLDNDEVILLKRYNLFYDFYLKTHKAIEHYLCNKYHKGAVFMIVEDRSIKLDNDDQKIIKIYYKINPHLKNNKGQRC